MNGFLGGGRWLVEVGGLWGGSSGGVWDGRPWYGTVFLVSDGLVLNILRVSGLVL
jgi:hypothetical protein